MDSTKLTRIDAQAILAKFKQGAVHHSTPDKDGDYTEFVYDTKLQKMIAYHSSFLDNSKRTSYQLFESEETFIDRVLADNPFDHFEKML